jgi:hypothetical protein
MKTLAACTITVGTQIHVLALFELDGGRYMVTKNGVIVGMSLDEVDDAQREFAELILSFKL